MKSDERTTMKRSSALRSQRSQREQERISQAAERARHPSSMPPVMTRGNMAGAPGSRRKVTQTNVRRKYYYAIGNTGAEVRLPAMPVLRPSWRMLSGVMAIAFLAGVWAMWSSSTFQIDRINVLGAKRIPQADIVTALNLAGESILQASPKDLEQTLDTSFPDLATASVQVGLPASVVVRVQERQPILIWQGDKQTVWIDASGMAFPPRGDAGEGLITVQAKGNPPAPVNAADTTQGAQSATSTPAVTPTPDLAALAKPPVDQSTAGPFISADLIAAIQKLSRQAPANTPILYDPHYGLGWKDPQGWVVYFGSDISNMDLKLSQLKVITGELATDKIVPAMISVEFPYAPFYRLEQ